MLIQRGERNDSTALSRKDTGEGDLPYVRTDKRLRCIKQTYRVYCYDSDIIERNLYTLLGDTDLICDK